MLHCLKKIGFFLSFFTLLIGTFASTVQAAQDFLDSSIRLDRLEPNASPLPILIQAKTATASLETAVRVTVGSAWSVSSTPADATVSTVGLPAGISPWPGIGPGTAINGQAITFPSGDLSTGVEYGFYLTGGVGINPATGIGAAYLWQLETLVASITDSSSLLRIAIGNDTVSITGTVPAKPSDYEFSFIPLQTGSNIPQNTTLSYQMTYGSNLAGPSNLTLQAEWTRGTVDGSSTQSVDIVDYVIGSATNGYNASAPVVDLVNRRITWNINNFPGGTQNQTITFSLRTNDSYSGAQDVFFTVSARLSDSTLTLPDVDIDQSYRYQPIPTTTSTPTSTPTPSASPQPPVTQPAITLSPSRPTSAPTPTATLPLTITHVEIISITSTSITLAVDTSQPTTLTTLFGLTADTLNGELHDSISTTRHVINMASLQPETPYLIKLKAENSAGEQVTSDLLLVSTAKSDQRPHIIPESLTVTSENIVLYNGLLNHEADLPWVVIPHDMRYTVRFQIQPSELVRGVELRLYDSAVLGLRSDTSPDPGSDKVTMVEVEPGTFVGQLKSPPQDSRFQINARINDYNGNLFEEGLTRLRTIPRLKITRSGTSQPIENAQVIFSLYNSKTLLYEQITAPSLPIQNPDYSETNGEVIVVLPQARYQVDVSAHGYSGRTVTFTIGTNEGEGFPVIELEKLPFNLFTWMTGIVATLQDTWVATQEYLQKLATSSRMFDLIAAVSIFCLVVITTIAYSARHHIELFLLPIYLFSHMGSWGKRRSRVEGVVLDQYDQPVENADVIVKSKDEQIIVETKTHHGGVFSFNQPTEDFTIVISKDGFLPLQPITYRLEVLSNHRLHFKLTQTTQPPVRMLNQIALRLNELLGSSFETLLLMSIVLEVLFAGVFAWWRVAPYLVITVFNLGLWVIHRTHARK